MGRGATVLDPPVAALLDAPEGGTDHELVAAVRRGDDRAFERLYSRYQRRISAYVFGMVKDHGRAEDITQEVFISALRRMRETERPINFKPWVYEIAKNACIDQFRRSRRTEEVSFDAGEGLGERRSGPPRRRGAHARRRGRRQAAARPPLRRLRRPLGLASRDPRAARVRGPLLPRDRRPHGPQPPRRREHAVPRPQAPGRGVRRARLGRALRAHPVDHRLGRERSARRARLAPPRPPHLPLPAVPPRRRVASGLDVAALAHKPLRKRIAERAAAFLPLPGFLRARLLARRRADRPGLGADGRRLVQGRGRRRDADRRGRRRGRGPATAAGPRRSADKAKPASAVQRSSAGPRAARARRPLGTTPSRRAPARPRAAPAAAIARRSARPSARSRASARAERPGTAEAARTRAPRRGRRRPSRAGRRPSGPAAAAAAARPCRACPRSSCRRSARRWPIRSAGQVDRHGDQAGQTVTDTVDQVTDTVDEVTDTVEATAARPAA